MRARNESESGRSQGGYVASSRTDQIRFDRGTRVGGRGSERAHGGGEVAGKGFGKGAGKGKESLPAGASELQLIKSELRANEERIES